MVSFSLDRSVQTTHADIAGGITPFDRILQMGDSVSRILDPATHKGAMLLDQMIDHQARIIAYSNDYRLMMLTVVPPLLLLGLMRRCWTALGPCVDRRRKMDTRTGTLWKGRPMTIARVSRTRKQPSH